MERGFGHRAPLGLRTLHAAGTLGGLGDARLVERFLDLEGSDREDAFSVLVHRHGPNVAGVCRRMLGGAANADADDAFQAVFLVLARKAGSLRRVDDLGPWLRAVAVRVALEARRRSARLRSREGGRLVDPPAAAATDPDLFELRAFLDEELQRLPRRYREPLRLCELEGATRHDAARRLGIPEGTLSTRLARGRVMLRDRLTRRGVAVGSLGAMFPAPAKAGSLGLLADASTRLALKFAARDAAAGSVPAAVASLAEGVLQMIHAAKLKSILLASSTLIAACLTAGLAWGFVSRDDPRAPDAEPPKAEAEARADDAKPVPVILRGVVVDETGNPVAGAEVLADPFGFFESRGIADGNGAFAIPFPDRLMGRQPLLLARTPDGRKVGIAQPIHRGGGEAANVPFRIVVKPGREVVSKVADERGKPIAGALVEVAGRLVDSHGAMYALAHETTGADGAARLLIPVDSEVAWIVGKKEGRGLDFAEYGAYAAGVPASTVSSGAPAAAIPKTTALTLGAPRVARIKAVDDAGQPVAGVPFYPTSLAKLGRRGALGYSSRALLATTDRDGEAAFDWLPQLSEPLVLLPISDDYARPRVAFNPGGDSATIRMAPAVAIRGRVVQPDGSTAEGVKVIAVGSGRGNGNGWGQARTAADGSYVIKVAPDEGYAVWVEDEDRAAPARLDVAVRSGQPVDGVDFRLGPGTLIHGTVTADSDGSPVRGPHVNLTETGDEVPADLREKDDPRRREFSRSLDAPTDDRGRYAIRVGPGVYRVRSRFGQRGSAMITVTNEADLIHDIQISIPPKRVRLAGRVVGPDGRALAGAMVRIFDRQDVRAAHMPVRTSVDGRFEFEWIPHHGYVYAKSLDESLGAFVAIGPETADITIPLAPTASIRGGLVDEMGEPAANQRLALSAAYPTKEGEKPINGGVHDRDSATDAEGRFETPGLVIGLTYRIHIYLDTGTNRSRRVGEAQIRTPEPLDLGTLRIGDRDFEKDAPKAGDAAPELPAATMFYGKPAKLADFKGKFILLHFAGAGSMISSPGLLDVYNAFGDDDRLVILNYFGWDSSVDVWKFQLKRGLPWSGAFIEDPAAPGKNPFGVRALPNYILIGPDGKIVARGMPEGRVPRVVARAIGKAPAESR